MQTSHKINVGELTPTLLEQHDVLFIDRERRTWQLILYMGIHHRWRLAGRTFYRWLLFHPIEGYQVNNLEASITVYLDAPT
jgi:hypothetical protein